jgi:TDG/mug DNA glycosylase family protein
MSSQGNGQAPRYSVHTSAPTNIWKPTKEQLAAAVVKKIPDVIAPGLEVLFCGINPSLYSAAVGHHFARPGNRFWPALHLAGRTDRLLSPFEDAVLVKYGLGITNVVDRATAAASELSDAELIEGARKLRTKIRRRGPKLVAFLGIGAYRTAFGFPAAVLGRQPESLASSRVWVLPNPSGLNAHYQLPALASLFGQLRLELCIT